MAEVAEELKIEMVALDKLKGDPKNARKHPERQIKAIEASLREFGQRRPIVCTPDFTVVAGNGTLEAARRIGWDQMAVTVLPFKDPKKARAFALADNRTSDLSQWDDEMLLDALTELKDTELLDVTGFSIMDVDDLLAVADLPEAPPMGVAQRRTLDERVARYANQTLRILMAEYPNHVYVWIIERLTRIREELGLDSNADVIVALGADYVGEEAPSMEVPDGTAGL